MADFQGWRIDAAADHLIFYTAPETGADIDVEEWDAKGTDLWAFGSWSVENGYPSEVEFFGDRLLFAATPAQPQTVWASQVGDYDNFGISSPIVDSDTITATLNARQLNEIRDLIPLDSLQVMTSGGEWRATGGADDVLAPATIGFKPASYYGTSTVPALIIGDAAIFLERSGTVVRDMAGTVDPTTGYRQQGTDLRVFAGHLTEGKPIVDWCYQQYPFSIVWLVRDDGVLLAMTYMREQEILAWTPMEIDGFVESIACVPEGKEDAVYAVVIREVEGGARRYIERLTPRVISDVRDGKFLDSCLTFDGRNGADVWLKATGATYAVDDIVTIAAEVATFDLDDVGDQIVFGLESRLVHDEETGKLKDIGPVNCRMEITGYTANNEVQARILTPMPEAFQDAEIVDWAFARSTMAGLEHLEGQTVGILADGFVQPEKVVEDGEIALTEPGALVHVGLPYTSDFQTLDLHITGRETIRMRAKRITRVGLVVENTRSIKAGPNFANASLDELEPRQVEDTTQPPALLNELQQLWIKGGWDVNSRVCVRQEDPLPMTILAIIPEFELGT